MILGDMVCFLKIWRNNGRLFAFPKYMDEQLEII
jgi:hypothetical protein